MQNQDLIPEMMASQLAGVSTTTLARFVEAGYLRVSDTQGEKNYSKKEICQLFAIDAENPEEDSYLAAAIEVVDPEGRETEQQESIEQESQPDGEKVYWADTVSAPASEDLKTSQAQIEENLKDKAEITRLRNITMMQDKILEMRENEIEELKKEREWLRTRVERLEEKSERDQLLLLAETQTIKRLVNITHQKKPSTMRLALEWFGILPPSQDKELEIINSKKVIE